MNPMYYPESNIPERGVSLEDTMLSLSGLTSAAFLHSQVLAYFPF